MASVKRGKALVASLRAQPGVRDPEALAAYLGRFKKARKAGKGVGAAQDVARGIPNKIKDFDKRTPERNRALEVAKKPAAEHRGHPNYKNLKPGDEVTVTLPGGTDAYRNVKGKIVGKVKDEGQLLFSPDDRSKFPRLRKDANFRVHPEFVKPRRKKK